MESQPFFNISLSKILSNKATHIPCVGKIDSVISLMRKRMPLAFSEKLCKIMLILMKIFTSYFSGDFFCGLSNICFKYYAYVLPALIYQVKTICDINMTL